MFWFARGLQAAQTALALTRSPSLRPSLPPSPPPQTPKVGFYPVQADGTNCFSPIAFHPSNRKGYDTTREAIDLCLAKLQLTYVDLLLIHNPLTDLVEYNASAVPHAFELSKSILTNEERELIFAFRLSKVKYDEAAGEAVRAATWKALEEAHTAGKTRFIGVSNYTTRQCAAMAAYATVMPAVNQLELHPRASSPALRAAATAEGMVIIAYGSCNSVALEKSPVVAAIATRRGVSPLAVVLRWTLHKGVVIIPRTANVKHMEDNMKVAMGGEPLCEADVAALDALNEAHFYYWLPAASLPPGSKADL